MLRDRPRVRELAEHSLAIGRERGLPLILAISSVQVGWAIGGTRGIELIREGLARHEAMGTVIYLPQHRLLLAEVYARAGRLDEAWALLEASLASGIDPALQVESEPLLRGAILLRRGEASGAEACFRRSLETARAIGIRSIELRAATELASLLRDRGETDQARALLRPVYAGYTEGFDTRDLQEAKAVLDALG